MMLNFMLVQYHNKHFIDNSLYTGKKKKKIKEMEAFGSFLDEEWESLSKMFSSEDSEFLLHFINGENLFPNKVDDQSLSFPSDAFDQTNFYCVSQENSNSSDIENALLGNPVGENGVRFLHNVTTKAFESPDFCTADDGLNMVSTFPYDHVMEENTGIQTAETADFYKEMTFKRKYETQEIQTSSDQSPKKKPRVSKDNGQKKKINMQSKRNKKAVQNDEEENINGVGNGQSSSTCSNEEDDYSNCNVSQELNGGSTSESKGKGRATDPQSLYARRRRERINERLRILQNLVPNGTKVDISTMLEEAVHYVKFLQLQIKLLSSDDLWMYAPIAYNGMDIGLLS